MASSVVDIFNLACGILRLPNVQSQTENTRHAVQLNALYEPCRRKAIVDHPWNGCMKRESLVRHSTTPAFKYLYYYVLPGDCLRVMDVFNADGIRTNQEYKVEMLGTGSSAELLLATDDPSVNIEYIADVDNPGFFRNGLDFIIANELARRAAPRFGLNATELQYLKLVHDADKVEIKGNDGQEGTDDEIESDIYIRARVGSAWWL